MLIDIPHDNDTLHLPPEFVAETISHADRVAIAAASALQSLKITSEETQSIPGSVVLELGALEQLRCWELAWREAYPAGLPSFSDAQQDLLRRLKEEPATFGKICSATLSLQIFTFQMKNLAWNVPRNCQMPFIIADDDSFLDDLAEVLWETRTD